MAGNTTEICILLAKLLSGHLSAVGQALAGQVILRCQIASICFTDGQRCHFKYEQVYCNKAMKMNMQQTHAHAAKLKTCGTYFPVECAQDFQTFDADSAHVGLK